ncbi:MAG: segregation/condensation protein A [Oscillospiraceae bacterium]|nr:segregation/condensation protein A [Oscillospiraceae bacterium]
MEALQYKLEHFEGPMDLLLHFVSQRKVSIHDVPIFSLIEQYLEYIRQMREARLEVTAEFLEMAARLVYIKTASLLPAEPSEELAEELRAELLEYRDCQLLAGALAERAKGFGYLARAPLPFAPDYTYTHTHRAEELFHACLAAVGKGKRKLPPPVEAFSGIIAHTIVSVVSRYSYLFEKLRLRKRSTLMKLLEESRSRSELVATFLAVLMLAKANRVKVIGAGGAAVLELQTKEEEWRDIEDE